MIDFSTDTAHEHKFKPILEEREEEKVDNEEKYQYNYDRREVDNVLFEMFHKGGDKIRAFKDL